MQIEISSYPWQQFEALLSSGKLDDEDYLDSEEYEDLVDGSETLEEGIGDSYRAYHGMYNDAGALENKDFGGSESFQSFASTLLNEEFESDVEEMPESFEAIFTPKRLKELSALASEFDLGAVEAAHREIADSEPELLEHSTDDFVQFIKALTAFVRRAADRDECVAISIG